MLPLLPVFGLLVSASAHPLTIGAGENRPYIYTQPNGSIAGFQYDVFEEAARREGIRLRWIRTGSSEANTKSLLDGTLSLLPMALASADRRGRLFISQTWWTEPSILLTRADREAPTGGTRLAVAFRLEEEARQSYPHWRFVGSASAPAALAHLCDGSADAALVGTTFIRQLVSARPRGCEGVPLQISDSPVRADFSIIANFAYQRQAERLRARITEMTVDGTLARIAERHPPISTPQATRMADELRARYRSQRLQTLLFFVSAGLLAGAFILVRQVRSRRQLAAIIEEQERTALELRESQSVLRHRTAELVRSNEDLQAFAYSVSHDLQEPLRNQCLFSELLEMRYADDLPTEGRDYVRTIRSSAIRMHEMMTGLLGFSRAGQTDRLRGQVDCELVVKRVLHDLRRLLQESGAEVEARDLPVVHGWEDRLQQVFQNLIENAVKYRREGTPPRITVSAAQEGTSWKFAISDNGIGINPEYFDQIFGLFKRLHRRDRYGGSGIGLALCRRVVERHGGRLWVESTEGSGSTFYFTVPVDGNVAEDALRAKEECLG
jgi:signal transduction histidine kinase